MKNDWNIVLIANEYHTKSMKRALTLYVLGFAGTDTPKKTHHMLCKKLCTVLLPYDSFKTAPWSNLTELQTQGQSGK
jgi:hypothetical protein